MSDYISSLPDFSNKQRLSFLYSDLSAIRQTNPESHSASINWWSQTLHRILSRASRDQLILHVNASLLELLTVQGVGKPICLAHVIAQLVNQPPYPLIPLKEFLTSTAPINARHAESWPYWIAKNAVGRPLSWALRQMHVVDADDRPTSSSRQAWATIQGDYVFLSSLETTANAVTHQYEQNSHSAPSERLYSYDSFRSTFLPAASDSDLQVILQYLSRDCDVLRFDGKRRVIKFLSGDSRDAVDDTDVGIVQIYSTRRTLQEQIKSIEAQIQTLQTKISETLKADKKAQAMSALKSRKALDQLLSKRIASLKTLEKLVLGIETATGDLEIMRAYESASSILRQILVKPELQHDRVDQTMCGIEDVLADQQDINDAITQGSRDAVSAVGINVPDDDELERELTALSPPKESAEARDEGVADLRTEPEASQSRRASHMSERDLIKEPREAVPA